MKPTEELCLRLSGGFMPIYDLSIDKTRGIVGLDTTKILVQVVLTWISCIWPCQVSSATEDLNESGFYVTPNKIELGRISPDGERAFSIRIGNKSKKSVIIESVATTCSCVSPATGWKNLELRPGESRQVNFTLFADKSTRRRTRTILFKTNNLRRKYATVIVSYAVKPEYGLTAFPSKLDFGQVEPNTAIPLEVVLRSPYPEPLVVNSIRCSDSSILIHPAPFNGRPGTISYAVELPANFRPGVISESVVIDTPIGKEVVPVVGYKMDTIQCIPSHISFQPIRLGESTITHLLVRNAGGKEFRILHTTTKTEEIQVRIETGSELRTAHKLRLQFTPNEKRLDGVGWSDILLITDGFGTKTITCSWMIY